MIGENLKTLRKSRKLTQQDLAFKLGVSRQAICLWESNKRELKVSVIKKIARIFSVPIDDLVRAQERVNTQRVQNQKVTFALNAPEAKKVFLSGDFTAWKGKGLRMRKTREGKWAAKVDLEPGRYQYKFNVDNNWWTDPDNGLTEQCPLGHINSVKEIG